MTPCSSNHVGRKSGDEDSIAVQTVGDSTQSIDAPVRGDIIYSILFKKVSMSWMVSYSSPNSLSSISEYIVLGIAFSR